MGKYLRLMWHCTATPEFRKVSGVEIDQWHQGPLDLKHGAVRYKGKRYANRNALPNESIGSIPIKRLKGRGWKKSGYRLLVHLDGSTTEISPSNDDNHISSYELTNGAKGWNSTSVHFCYVGGVDANRNPKDTRTDAQKITMKRLTQEEISKHPNIVVGGHNQYSDYKACPSFNVIEWLRTDLKLLEKNISYRSINASALNTFHARKIDGDQILEYYINGQHSDGMIISVNGNLNIREQPINGSVITSFPNGTLVYPFERIGIWLRVTTEKPGVIGWVSQSYLKSKP